MMRIATVLLLLIISCQASAADWLAWQKVGSATLTWGPFSIYTSQLRTPDGQYHGAEQDRALIITYQRTIDSAELVDATREQWQAQGILKQEPQSAAWLQMLAKLWPNVSEGTQLAYVANAQHGQFWYRASPTQKTFTPLGPPQSAAFSERFLAIWLDPNTQYPELRQQLLGEKP